MKMIYVEWADAIANSSSVWLTKDEVIDWAKNSDCFVSEIGFVIEENKNELVLASRKQTISGEYEPQYGLMQKIPTAWIRRKVVIKLPSKVERDKNV